MVLNNADVTAANGNVDVTVDCYLTKKDGSKIKVTLTKKDVPINDIANVTTKLIERCELPVDKGGLGGSTSIPGTEPPATR